MPKADSSLNMLIVAAVVALGIGYYVPQTFSQKSPDAAAKPEASKPAPPKTAWAASAPGRVEPQGGELRITAQVPGRIADVLVGVNDKVAAGDLMVRLADEDLIARVHAARAEAAARKRDRDNETVGKTAQDRRTPLGDHFMDQRPRRMASLTPSARWPLPARNWIECCLRDVPARAATTPT